MEKLIRVLLVDDDVRFAVNLYKLLKSRNFDVIIASNGFEAIDAVEAEANPFDVVVLDVKMPVLDGIATLKRIKKLVPDIQVIMLTGHATLESGIEAIREGAFDYLLKPCDIEELVIKIEEATKKKREHEEKIEDALKHETLSRYGPFYYT